MNITNNFVEENGEKDWKLTRYRQILSLCITSTNTFSGLLGMEGTSIPAFQSFFNYVLLNLVYTSYTLYKYGFKGWCKMVSKEWWRCNLTRPHFPALS